MPFYTKLESRGKQHAKWTKIGKIYRENSEIFTFTQNLKVWANGMQSGSKKEKYGKYSEIFTFTQNLKVRPNGMQSGPKFAKNIGKIVRYSHLQKTTKSGQTAYKVELNRQK